MAPRRRRNRARRKARPGRRQGQDIPAATLSREGDEAPLGDFDTGLQAAAECARLGQKREVAALLKDLESRYPFADDLQNHLYLAIRAIGLSWAQRWVEAERVALDLLRHEPRALDAHYALAQVYTGLGEFDRAVTACQTYLSLAADSDTTSAPRQLITNSSMFRSMVHVLLGDVCRGRQRLETAAAHYREAMATGPGSQAAYLRLAELLRQTGQAEEARQVVARGIEQCPQTEELRLLNTTLTSRPTISACMIVRDEEELLPGCLDSIRDWVDDIVVVDTGSVDRTPEIARSYGARVFFQEWEDDFSKHRNFSLAQATSEWILVIDADERIGAEEVPKIQRHLASGQARVIVVNVFNTSGKFDEQMTFLPSIRLFKRELGLRYEGIVHNQIQVEPSEPRLRSDINLKHLGYGLSKEKMKAKAARTVALLEKQLKEDPDFAYGLFNYAQVLLGMGLDEFPEHVPKVLEAAGRAVKLTGPEPDAQRHIHLMCLVQMANTCFITCDYPRAKEYARRALEAKPDYLDPLLLLGAIHLRTEEFDRAETYYRQYLDVLSAYNPTDEQDGLILLHLGSRHLATYGLAVGADERGDYRQAEKWYRQTLRLMPEFMDVNGRLGEIFRRDGRLPEAEEFLRKELAVNPESVRAATALVDVCYRLGHQDEAAERLEEGLGSNNPSELAEFASLAIAAGQTDQAARFLLKACSLPTIEEEAQRRCAGQLFSLGHFEDAAAVYRTLLERVGERPDLVHDLAGCCFNLGRFSEAEALYERVVELVPSRAAAFRNLGLTRVKLGKIQEAALALKKCLELGTDPVQVTALLGDLYVRSGEHRAAIPLYEQYLRSRPDAAPVLFRLSECYLLMGHRDAAILGYRKVVQMDREFQPARQRLAELEPVSEQA